METKYMNWLIENNPMDKEVPPGVYAIRGDDGAFYTFETTQPIPEGGVIRIEEKGKYIIKVCDGTACHIRKSTAILDALHKQLGLTEGKHTTDDRLFTVETVSCLGACGLAPAITVNDHVYPQMTPEKIAALLTELRGTENETE